MSRIDNGGCGEGDACCDGDARCSAEASSEGSAKRCPRCGTAGRRVDRITVKSMLRPAALVRLSAPAHRFCPSSECPAVYFGRDEVFETSDVVVPVFQKAPPGERPVCYCLGIGEAAIRRELAEVGRSTAAERVTALVKAERCACEIKNPQGSCCLGNVALATKAASAGLTPASSSCGG